MNFIICLCIVLEISCYYYPGSPSVGPYYPNINPYEHPPTRYPFPTDPLGRVDPYINATPSSFNMPAPVPKKSFFDKARSFFK